MQRNGEERPQQLWENYKQTVKAVYFDIGPFQTDNVLNSHQKLNIEMKTKIENKDNVHIKTKYTIELSNILKSM